MEAFQQALTFLQQGNMGMAHDLLVALTEREHKFPDAWFLLALCQSHLGKKQQAILSNQIAIRLNPEFVEAYINRGADFLAVGQYEAAESDLRQALVLNPTHPQANLNLGNVLRDTGRLEAAEGAFAKATELAPAYTDAWCNLADVRGVMGKTDEAVFASREALRVDPRCAQAYNTLGLIYAGGQKTALAIEAYEQAIRLSPQYTAAYNNLALVLMAQKNNTAARAILEKAFQIEPRSAAVNNNLGNLLISTGQPEKAIKHLQVSYEEDPAHDYVAGTLLHAKMKICDWTGLDSLLKTALESATSHAKYAQVFTLLAMPSTLLEQKQCAEHYVANQFGSIQPLAPAERKDGQEKICIAYLSADFYGHATAYLMAELFELHDRRRFEVIGICYGRSQQDIMRQRVIQAFDQFYEVADQSDLEIAGTLQTLGVDIAIDLKGHTTDARLGILAYRPAPVQVHYLGYPGTLGASFIDYLIADPVLIPLEHQDFYTEKIAYLPDCYQVNDSKRQISDRIFSRAELGLPETGFVFCSFNNNFKITPDLFDVWMNLLKRVDGSVLWLFQDNPTAADNLRKEAVARGVDADRLVFAERMPLEEHLARHCCADLFLDTWYYNAHTTASDALWAGLPLVTKVGDTFAGRVAASLLTAIALPELITKTPDAYEALAFELATNSKQLQSIKHKLEENRGTTSLFDTQRFTRNLERCYEEMLSAG